MVRLVLVLAAVAVGFVAVRHLDVLSPSGAASAPQPSTAVPAQFRSLLAARPDPAALLRSRGALPGLGAIRKLTGGDEPEAAPVMKPFADVGTRAALRAVRADIRRDLAALNRLSASGGAAPAEVSRTLAQVYSSPVLADLGADGRRAFAEEVSGRTRASQRIRVLDFGGVFVSGRRALAQVVYRLSVRAPSGRYVARAPQTWTVTLAREAGRWRFVRGFESGT